jgi:hypothetical protein
MFTYIPASIIKEIAQRLGTDHKERRLVAWDQCYKKNLRLQLTNFCNILECWSVTSLSSLV